MGHVEQKPLRYAKETFSTTWNGTPISVRKDEAWEADDSFVRAFRQNFADYPSAPRSSAPRPAAPAVPIGPPTEEERPIERGTAAPGERRPVERGTGRKPTTGTGW